MLLISRAQVAEDQTDISSWSTGGRGELFDKFRNWFQYILKDYLHSNYHFWRLMIFRVKKYIYFFEKKGIYLYFSMCIKKTHISILTKRKIISIPMACRRKKKEQTKQNKKSLLKTSGHYHFFRNTL
jgi:hypothetical protein